MSCVLAGLEPAVQRILSSQRSTTTSYDTPAPLCLWEYHLLFGSVLIHSLHNEHSRQCPNMFSLNQTGQIGSSLILSVEVLKQCVWQYLCKPPHRTPIFPSLFSHFTRDFVGDFDILLMLKVGLKGDGEGRQQQREGRGGGGGRGEGLWWQEWQRFGVMSEEGWQPQQTCKLVERWSISIYIESQKVPTSIAVSPARIAKEYRLPNSPNWDIIQFLRMLSSNWNTHTHTGSCPGDKILSRGQNCFVPGTKSCPWDKTVLSLCVRYKINNFVPAVYIARA